VRRRSKRQEGITIIEVAIVVCVVGVLLAVAVPAFLRELRVSKISEAPTELARLHDRTAAYYTARRRGPDRNLTECLPSPAGPTPRAPSLEPATADFSDPTWTALDYAPERPVRFRYTFVPVGARCGLRGRDLVTLRAEGDLDGDGKYSVFERVGGLDAQGAFAPTGILYVFDRTE
jgi:type II secretory pathway pseudopilin PulG